MSRASKTERTLRLNAAVAALREHGAPAAAAKALAAGHGLSLRQAYRYVQAAQELDRELPVPERTMAFTVKLPLGLIRAVRGYAARTGRTLSEVVGEAVRRFVSADRGRG